MYRELKKELSKGLTTHWINGQMNWTDISQKKYNGQQMHEETLNISLVIKEMQVKMTLESHLTPVKMAIINNTNN
jgi:hypothetical protein